MDLKQTQYFVALYEEQSMTRAAQRLHIVQPALSMQIAKLEQDVGRQLFRRHSRGVTPTPAGDEMYTLFAPIVTAFSSAKTKVVRSGGQLLGHVEIGVLPSLGHSILADVLLSFAATHPRVTLAFTEGPTDPLSESVANGRLDLALINRPSSEHDLTIEPVLEEEVVLVSPGHIDLGIPDRVAVAEILAHEFVMPTKGHGLRQLVSKALLQSRLSIIPIFEVDSFVSLAMLVNKGHYLAFFPAGIVRNLAEQSSIVLRTHHLIDPVIRRELICASSPRRPLGSAAQALSQALNRAIQHAGTTETHAKL